MQDASQALHRASLPGVRQAGWVGATLPRCPCCVGVQDECQTLRERATRQSRELVQLREESAELGRLRDTARAAEAQAQVSGGGGGASSSLRSCSTLPPPQGGLRLAAMQPAAPRAVGSSLQVQLCSSTSSHSCASASSAHRVSLCKLNLSRYVSAACVPDVQKAAHTCSNIRKAPSAYRIACLLTAFLMTAINGSQLLCRGLPALTHRSGLDALHERWLPVRWQWTAVQEAAATREALGALKAQFVSYADLLEDRERDIAKRDMKVRPQVSP